MGREVPDGIGHVVRGDSAFVRLVVERPSADHGAPPLFETVGDHIGLEPLSAHLGRPAPPPAPTVRWWPFTNGSETSEDFWSCASFALSLTVTNHLDVGLLERVAEISVVPGAVWDPLSFQPAIRAAIAEGMDDALIGLTTAASTHLAHVPGRRSRRDFDRDYFARALDSVSQGIVGRAVSPDGDAGPRRSTSTTGGARSCR